MTEPKTIQEVSDTGRMGNNCLEAVNLSAERSNRILDELSRLLEDKSIKDPEILRTIGKSAVHAAIIQGAMEKIGSSSTNMAQDKHLLSMVRR